MNFGIYQFSFYKMGQWHNIIIDDLVSIYKQRKGSTRTSKTNPHQSQMHVLDSRKIYSESSG